MTDVDALVKEMREGLEGVTPGPWTVIPAIPYDGDDDGLEGAFVEPVSIEGDDGNPVCVFGSALGSGSLFENERDHEHINRCSPENITAILDALAASEAARIKAEGEVERLRAAISWIEPPFVDENTPVDELRFRVEQTIKDAERASLRREP